MRKANDAMIKNPPSTKPRTMPEFKFPCPQCKQHIQCDPGYVGTQINCPACGKPVVVPPPPSVAGALPKDTIQIKLSTLRTAAIIALGVLLAAALVWLSVDVLFAGPRKVTFRAYVDGTDVVKISGSRLWIEHLDFEMPNKMRINGEKWNPSWNGNTSAIYKLRRSLNPRTADNIKLLKQLGRGEISIMEKPTPANDQTLSVKVDDGPFGGADWYEFTISW